MTRLRVIAFHDTVQRLASISLVSLKKKITLDHTESFLGNINVFLRSIKFLHAEIMEVI